MSERQAEAMTPHAGAVPPAPRPRVAAYSRFVGLMRFLLPTLAVILLGLVVVWPQLALRDERAPVGTSGDARRKLAADALTMVSPRYFGTDSRNQPFSVTAELGRQSGPDGTAGAIELDAPRADMSLKDGTGVLIDARKGLYRQKDQTVDLSGGVDLYHEGGYEMHTPSAVVDLKAGGAEGREPVAGQGPLGRFEAQGFRVAERGRVMHLTGKTWMLIHPPRKEPR